MCLVGHFAQLNSTQLNLDFQNLRHLVTSWVALADMNNCTKLNQIRSVAEILVLHLTIFKMAAVYYLRFLKTCIFEQVLRCGGTIWISLCKISSKLDIMFVEILQFFDFQYIGYPPYWIF